MAKAKKTEDKGTPIRVGPPTPPPAAAPQTAPTAAQLGITGFSQSAPKAVDVKPGLGGFSIGITPGGSKGVSVTPTMSKGDVGMAANLNSRMRLPETTTTKAKTEQKTEKNKDRDSYQKALQEVEEAEDELAAAQADESQSKFGDMGDSKFGSGTGSYNSEAMAAAQARYDAAVAALNGLNSQYGIGGGSEPSWYSEMMNRYTDPSNAGGLEQAAILGQMGQEGFGDKTWTEHTPGRTETKPMPGGIDPFSEQTRLIDEALRARRY